MEHASYAGLSEKWVSACDLKCGDKVLLSDGTLCEVERVSCKKLSEPETTYNLEVADFHTYYVSDACVLVHNANCDMQRGLMRQKQAKMTNTKAISVNGNTRIPDYLDLSKAVMGEAKSVKNLSYSRQLRDMFSYAKSSNIKMFLKIERWTKLSKPLQSAIKEFGVAVNVF